ncbi:hypothetical protein D6783_00615 [Candidatus Woesearchaeota archaeon]|nr:MAG: hypothetical protein D6783_00615 [Candidatus Woesearchaeota archaeon]
MTTPNDALFYLILLMGLLGLAYSIRLMIVLERRLLAMERRNIAMDEHIEELLLQIQKTERHLERVLYKKK